MSRRNYGNIKQSDHPRKKTRQGHGKFSKWGSKGGGNGGSTPSKLYRKKPRGQGKRR